jgi:hypothetical protein
VFVILAEVKRLRLGRNSLARIVSELAAFFPIFHHTALGAEILSVFQLRAVLTVFTGFRHLLAKEHIIHLASVLMSLYTSET